MVMVVVGFGLACVVVTVLLWGVRGMVVLGEEVADLLCGVGGGVQVWCGNCRATMVGCGGGSAVPARAGIGSCLSANRTRRARPVGGIGEEGPCYGR